MTALGERLLGMSELRKPVEIALSRRLSEIPEPFLAGTVSGGVLEKLVAMVANGLSELSVSSSLVLDCSLDPDFKNKADIEAAGCRSPQEYLYRLLSPAEVVEYAEKIMEKSGLLPSGEVDLWAR